MTDMNKKFLVFLWGAVLKVKNKGIAEKSVSPILAWEFPKPSVVIKLIHMMDMKSVLLNLSIILRTKFV